LLGTLLVPRLLLSPLVANDTLIVGAGWWPLRFWHTFLAAMLAALILYTFQIIFLGHRDWTFPAEVTHAGQRGSMQPGSINDARKEKPARRGSPDAGLVWRSLSGNAPVLQASPRDWPFPRGRETFFRPQ
jgi:hypothetical protein